MRFPFSCLQINVFSNILVYPMPPQEAGTSIIKRTERAKKGKGNNEILYSVNVVIREKMKVFFQRNRRCDSLNVSILSEIKSETITKKYDTAFANGLYSPGAGCTNMTQAQGITLSLFSNLRLEPFLGCNYVFGLKVLN